MSFNVARPIALVIILATAMCGLAPQSRASDDKPVVANIVFQDDQFFRIVQFGARDGAKQLGVELREGNSQNKLDKERQLVETYITARVDAIVISPLSRKASVEAVKRAKAAGVIVVTLNTPVDGDYIDAAVRFDDRDMGYQTGVAAAKYINDHLGGKAKIAILQFKSQVPEQSAARTDGFRDALKDMPGVQIVADQDAWLAEAAMKKAGDILTAHPDINVIWSANEGGMLGSVLAVKTSGRAGKVTVFGIGASEQLISFLRSEDNILQAVNTPDPFNAGRFSVETAINILRKQPFEKDVMLKGTTLSRTAPAEIDAYEKQLKEWMSQGSK